MGGGEFPIDLLLFGMVAAFLVLRLRSILGRRTGFERPAQPEAAVPAGSRRPSANVVDLRPPATPAPRAMPKPGTVVAETLDRIAAMDRAFDPQHFLNGAEAAFRLIVSAFAAGDRMALRPLLTDGTYAGFETAITAREAAGETQRSEIRSIETVAYDDASLVGSHAAIAVRFVSDQVAETLDRDNKPVAGADAVAEITDIWTFERDISQSDPAWRLSATRSG